jgi:hypothetical protein
METNPPKLFICGHSHILKVMFDKSIISAYESGAAGKVVSPSANDASICN